MNKKFLLYLFALINLALFILVNQIPIEWQQYEIANHRFFWSTDLKDLDHPILRTGVQPSDFLKPFYTKRVEGEFRPRHFSYLIEMLSFKFWQALGVISFRDYSQVILHVLNTLLLGWLVSRITGNLPSGLLAGTAFLNCGIAINTLLLPFRNAKLLLIFLFLIAFHILITRGSSIFKDRGWKMFFAVVLLLMLFTDEIALFLIPILLIYAYSTSQNKREDLAAIIKLTFTIIIISIFSTIILYKISTLIDPTTHIPGYVKSGWLNVYLFPNFLLDIGRAFIFYFLKNNFGHWDLTFIGLTSYIAFLLLCLITYKNYSTENSTLFKIITIMLFAKNLLLPSTNVHNIIMPLKTIFPSLLFFKYYYPYIEACLIAFCLGICFKKENTNPLIMAVGLLTIINFGNVFNFKSDLIQCLQYHRSIRGLHADEIKKITRLEKFIETHKNKTIYLSFPSGNENFHNRGLFDNYTFFKNNYNYDFNPAFTTDAAILPVVFLKQIEEGRLIISLKNIPPKVFTQDNQEILKGQLFYDAYNEKIIDLSELFLKNTPPIVPRITNEILTMTINGQDLTPNVLFLIKGRSFIDIESPLKTIHLEQNFGQSYQMVLIPSTELFNKDINEAKITIKPFFTDQKIAYLGPFFINKPLK